MKTLHLYFSAVLIGICMWMAGTMLAEATDVWVDHWDYENVDVYVMDDTISYGTREKVRWFNISTKMVQNGQLQQVIRWEFNKYLTDMWRYQTNTMDRSHATVVIAPNRIFEYGMNQIGWSYYTHDKRYY